MDFKRFLLLVMISYVQTSFSAGLSPRFWGSAEYLYWWVQDSPISVPLITANSNPDAFGIINEPGTTIIFGSGSNKDSFDFGGLNGGRITIGAWLDPGSQYGIEANIFDLPKVKQSYSASSINSSFPVINIPFDSGKENVLVNKNTPNTASVSDTFQSYGFEINGLHTLQNNGNFPIIPFIGFRYLNIQENFTLNDTSFPASGIVSVSDHFKTKNNFYGFQAGAQSHSIYNKFFLDLSAALALGNNHQILNISGDTTFNNQVIQNFGIFSEPSNLGKHTNNIFSFIPELRIKLGYQFTQNIHAFFEYDGFYINHVIRPGNVIDRNINLSQNPLLGGSGVLSGPASPAPKFKNTSMWMQGLSFGVTSSLST